MANIRLLDSHTINQIAAGEVVERPASVVKELVENSIDAKATSITVEIKNGGIDLIRITDNGKGIPKEDVEIAFLRHATSKISKAEDLSSVLSLGFRGEALASIAAVSHLELLTKQDHDLTGKRVVLTAGKIAQNQEIACPVGTTIIMNDLFFNIPARKEFLKSPGSEGAKISDYMYKLALAHPEISFKYIQNNKLMFQTSGQHQLEKCVYELYGKETASMMIGVHDEDEAIIVTGLLGKPTLTRANRQHELFFINGRYIKSELLQKATEDAYKSLLTIGKFPFVVVHLKIDPNLVDVNVHPTKLEVRFKDEKFIYDSVYKTLYNQLHEENLIPTIKSFEKKEKNTSQIPARQNTQLAIDSFFTPREERTYNVYPPKVEVSKTPEKKAPIFTPKSTTPEIDYHKVAKESEPSIRETSKKQEIEEPDIYKPKRNIDYFIVGQLFKTYWIIEHEGKVLLMDQHAAHERVMYEKFLNDFKNGSVSTQVLLIPETLKLSASEYAFFEEHEPMLSKLGFIVETFGEDALIIREVPYVFGEPMKPSVFKDLLDEAIAGHSKDLLGFNEEKIIQMACKSAIKAKDNISEIECEKLIEALLVLENPYTCPHGRPTIVALTQIDIEKIFKRIQ